MTSRQQAQAEQTQGLAPTEFAAAEFGIKAKRHATRVPRVGQFAAAEFGIKAKPSGAAVVGFAKFAAAEFGIKAKRHACGE